MPVVAAVALSLAAAAASSGAAAVSGSARITGVGALTERGNAASATAATGAVERRRERVAGLREPRGAVGEVVVELEVSDEEDPRATGRVRVRDILLFGGRIAIAELEMAVAAPEAGGGPAAITKALATGLVVDGEELEAVPGTRIALEGLGTLILFEQARGGDGSIRANALRIEATEGVGAAAAASPFVIGHLSASAASEKDSGAAPTRPLPERSGSERPRPGSTPAPTDRSSSQAPPAPAPGSARAPIAPEPSRPEPTPGPTAPAPSEIPGLRTPSTSERQGSSRGPRSPESAPGASGGSGNPVVGGSVFPVFGDVSFSDDYGAPRAVTIRHQGNDLFAERGTPLVAVADGTLFKVGFNTLGGHRLWLRDAAGTEYYYAHMSAYAPGALEGARVRAGEVIGFVGNSGDAITTPPHVHFQIHPAGGDSVNPYPYIVSWQRGGATTGAPASAAAEPAPAGEAPEAEGQPPAVGAVIVGMEPELDQPPSPQGGAATVAR